jgi:hypothetical protein
MVQARPKIYKINVDPTFFADEGIGVTRAILRDDRGRFITTKCKFIPVATDAITMEATAMRDSLHLPTLLVSIGLKRSEIHFKKLIFVLVIKDGGMKLQHYLQNVWT